MRSLTLFSCQSFRQLPLQTLSACLLLGLPVAASAHGGIHQHGLGALDVAQEGKALIVHFRSPLDSLIGFETAPANEAQRAQARQLLDRLQNAAHIVQLPAAARCTHQAPRIEAEVLGVDDDDPDHDHDDDRDHADADDHGHTGKHAGAAGEKHRHDHDGHSDDDHDDSHAAKAKGGKAHGKHEHDHADNDGDDHDGGDGHSDLSVIYRFACENIDAVNSLTLTAFKSWPRLQQVDAVVVSDRGQQAERLSPAKNTLRW